MFEDIRTIARREVKKVLADKATLLISVIWPLFIIFIIGLGFDSFIEFKGLETTYLAFLGPGIIALMAMGGATYVGNTMINERATFIKELLVAPISRVSIFIGKIIGAMAIDFVIITIVSMIFLEAIGALSIMSVVWTLIFMFLIEFVFYGLSLLMGVFFSRPGTYQQIGGILSFVIISLSGAFFPVANLPIFMKIVSYINPLTYGVDGLRGQLIGVSMFPAAFNIFMLLAFGIATSLLGAFFFRRFLEA